MLNHNFTLYNLHTELDWPHNLHDGVASSPSTCSCCWICKLLVFLKQMCNMYMARMAQNGPKLIVIFWPDMVVSYSVQLMPQYDIVELLGFVIHFQTRLRVSFANTGASTRLELLGTEETSWLPSASTTPMTPMSLSSWYFYIVSWTSYGITYLQKPASENWGGWLLCDFS